MDQDPSGRKDTGGVNSISGAGGSGDPHTSSHPVALSWVGSPSGAYSRNRGYLKKKFFLYWSIVNSQVVLAVKNPPTNAEDIRDEGSTSGSGRSPGGGHGNPL